jgi:DNA-binding response OmpR family regulator
LASNSDFPAGKPAILVVQQNRFLRAMVCDWLHSEGYASYPAGDEHDVIEALQQRRFDLALLDMDLARGEGISLLRSVESKLSGVPLVLLTGAVNYDDVVAWVSADTPCVRVDKPYSFFALGLVLRAALARSSGTPGAASGSRRATCM